MGNNDTRAQGTWLVLGLSRVSLWSSVSYDPKCAWPGEGGRDSMRIRVEERPEALATTLVKHMGLKQALDT